MLSQILSTILFVLGVASACCPSGWVVHDGSCYLFSQQGAIFKDAQRYCKHYHGYLVNIGTRDENSFVQSFANGMKAESFFIGLTDLTEEGVWRWTDTDEVATFIDWARGQPDGNSSQNCMVLTYADKHKWHDGGCNDTYQYICELPQTGEVEIIG